MLIGRFRPQKLDNFFNMPKNEVMGQKGIVHLLPLLAILGLATLATFILVSKGIIQNPIPEQLRLFQKPDVELKSQYTNPFEADAQFVNPFSQYKNPFDFLK